MKKVSVDVILEHSELLTPLIATVITAVVAAEELERKDSVEYDKLLASMLSALGRDILKIQGTFFDAYRQKYGEQAAVALALKCATRVHQEIEYMQSHQKADELLDTPLVSTSEAKEVLNKFMKG